MSRQRGHLQCSNEERFAVDHHPSTWLAWKGRLEMRRVNDARMLSWEAHMRRYAFLVSKQLHALGMNASREGPSHQMRRHRVAVRFNGDQSFAAHHYTVEEAAPDSPQAELVLFLITKRVCANAR